MSTTRTATTADNTNPTTPLPPTPMKGKEREKESGGKKSYALGNSAELLGLKMSGDDSLLRGRGQCLCTQTTCDTFYRCEFAPVHLTEEGGKKIPLGLKGSNDTSSQERYVSEF